LHTIYKAIQIATGNNVFLTLIPVRPGPTLKTLSKRAEQAKKFTHPGLVAPLDYGILPNDHFYYTQSAIPSSQLVDVLEQVTHTSNYWFNLAHYFIKTLELVAYIHSAGTTHRDIATNHIRVDRKGNVSLEGYINPRLKSESRNIANIVHLPYMSPEQLRGAPADRKTDIYSLGVTFFELITGQVPYESNYVKIDEISRGITPSLSHYRLNIPEEIELMSLKALAPREHRYNNVYEWIQDLEKFYNQRSLLLKLKDFSSTIKNILAFKT
jgi:serine/threonine-protein kinase